MKILQISDTHNRHQQLINLPGANFYNNRASNAAAESFNSKIKLFRTNLRGIRDKSFFLFRIKNLYA